MIYLIQYFKLIELFEVSTGTSSNEKNKTLKV